MQIDGIDLDDSPSLTLDPPQLGEGSNDASMSLDPSIPMESVEIDGISLTETAPAEADIPLINSDTTGMPTIESWTDLPRDLGQRTLAHAKGGIESFVGGATALAPGTENTIWRMPVQGEGKLPYALSKLAPLGLIGGPIETLLSPATAVMSEGLRLSGEAEKKFGGPSKALFGDDIPLAHRMEKFAPLLSGLVAAPALPAALGGTKPISSAAKASKQVGRIEQGLMPLEQGVRGLESIAPSAKTFGAMLRDAPYETGRFSAMMRGHQGLEKALDAMTPAQQQLFLMLDDGSTTFARARATMLSAGETDTVALLDKYQSVVGPKGLRPQLAEAVGLRGKTVEGKDVPFSPMVDKFYLPHVYAPETSKKIREFIDAEAFAKGKPITTRYPIAMGEDRPFIAQAARGRGSAIPEANEWIRDIPAAVRQSTEDFSRTLGRAKAFGPREEKLNEVLRNIATEIGGPEGVAISKRLYDSLKRDYGPTVAKNVIMDSVRSFQALTKMPLSFISNATQTVITGVVAGARNTTRALYDTLAASTRGELTQITKELGIINKQITKSIEHEIGGAAPKLLQQAAHTALKPFEWVERFNQAVAARAGELATTRLSDKLARTGNLAPREWRWLKNSDIDIAAVQARGGGLLPHEIKRAAWGLLDRTQFLARPTAMPAVMSSSPLMRLAMQMKTFSTRASFAIWNEVVKEAKLGNYRPMQRLLTYYPLSGEVARRIGGTVRGREAEPLPEDVAGYIKRGLSNMMYVGGLGIALDSINAMTRGKEAALGFATGPGIADIAGEGKMLYDMFQHRFGGIAEQKKYKKAQKNWVRGWAKRVPFAGPALNEMLKSPTERRKYNR